MVTASPAMASSLRARPTHTIAELSQILSDRSREHHDFTVNTGDLHVSEEDGTLCVRSAAWKEFKLRPTALNQLCSKIGVPAAYARKCSTGLQAENLNYWLYYAEHRDILLRCDGDEVRAVLSPKYQAIDHLDVLRSVGDAYGSDAPLRFELGEDQLVIQLVDRRPDVAGQEDLLHPGIGVRNSETGLSSVEVSGFIYRVVCLNGLILTGRSVQWRRRHIGKESVLGQLDHAVNQAREASSRSTSTFAGTQGVIVPEMHKFFDKVVSSYGLSESQDNAIRWAFQAEPGETLYHAINSVTRAAHHEDLNLDQRRILQETGGRMLAKASEGYSWLA